jgi:thioredoxin-related protein
MVCRRLIAFSLSLLVVATPTLAADSSPKPATAAPAPAKPLTWYAAYRQACAEAKKSDRLILCYFCGSDWDEWTKKLDKEVFSGDMFRQWAEKNVILLKLDILKFKTSPQSDEINRLKLKYNITKVPTLLFLDSDGLLIARCGYETASLREDEDRGKPATWIKHCDDVIEHRPPPEPLIEQKTLDDAIKYSRKHYLPLVLLVNKPDFPPLIQKQKAELLKNQPFVKFINQNFAFVQLAWPAETDTSEAAKQFRDFIAENKIPPAALQLIVWDFYKLPPASKLRDRIMGFTADTDPLIERLDKAVENPDYDGKWLDDFPQARFIANRLRRPLFLYFTQSDGNEYAEKFEQEIFQTDAFKQYARKNLVLLKLDYPKTEEKQKAQSEAIRKQNKELADQYAIRGYPMVILLNFMGQRIGDSKYMKGGPEYFIKELDQVVKNDRFSRP